MKRNKSLNRLVKNFKQTKFSLYNQPINYRFSQKFIPKDKITLVLVISIFALSVSPVLKSWRFASRLD